MADWYVSETVRITATFTDSAGDASDPSAVDIVIADPAGAATEYSYAAAEITKSGTGVYYVDHVVDSHGWWEAWVKGSGTSVTIEPSRFQVWKSRAELA